MEYQKILLGENPYFVSCVYESYQMHCHHEIELMYCIRGEIRVRIEEEEYIMKERSILLISSMALHQIIIEQDALAVVLEFGSQFLGTEYNRIAAKSFSKCHIGPLDDCAYRNRLEKPLKRIYKEYMERNDASYWVIQGGLYEIFAMIVRYVPMHPQSSQKKKNLEQYMKIQKVFDLVQNEYYEEITLEWASALVGYDSRAFCRLFKSITNMTFHDYLNAYRINISRRLLEQEACSIGEVGQMVGIPVAKTFSRLFRKYTGMSPRDYRSLYQERLSVDL